MKKLEELYYDPKRGFNNVNDLVRKAKEENLGLTREEIKKWYKSQPINQIYYHRIDKDYHSIRAPNRKVGTLQADLMFTDKYKRENKDPKNKSSYKFSTIISRKSNRLTWMSFFDFFNHFFDLFFHFFCSFCHQWECPRILTSSFFSLSLRLSQEFRWGSG